MMDPQQRQAHIKREKAKARDLRKSDWWRRRLDSARCYYCDAALQPLEATMDHIVPLSRGGKTTKGNVVVCCKDCNTKKRDHTSVEWMLNNL